MDRIRNENEPKIKDDFTDWMKENKDKLNNIIDAHEQYLDEKAQDKEYER